MSIFTLTRPRSALLALIAFVSALTVAGLSSPAQAQANYPDKPIRVVVPYTPGGGSDTNARMLAQPMSTILGQPIVIENKPGASGVVGAMAVLQSPADGYTVFYDSFAYAVNAVMRQLPFDPIKDMIPVSQAINMPLILVVPASSPFKTVKELVDFAKANPNKLDYGSYGAGGAAHLAAEMLQRDAGIQWVHVPYKGGAQAIADVLAGRLAGYFSNPITALPHVKSGKVRPLGTTGATKMEALPDVPTFEELGYPGFQVVEWNGFFVAKGTPAHVIERLAKAIHEAAKDPVVKARMESMGIEPVGNTPEQFSTFLQGEIKQWRALVQSNNIRAD
ncbi:MAG: tripartite tricarboxylate transporter substrate binding protein [Alcaligenaceae bacterium]